MNAPASLLAIENLTVRFGGLVAVDHVSFEVKPGSIHALIGPNGAGKTTVFNCISRFYQPATGALRFGEHDLLTKPRHRLAELGVARTFQNLELFGELSVFENVLIGTHSQARRTGWLDLFRAGNRPGEHRDRIEHALEQTGIADVRHVKARALDFGRQKMLELARALAVRPTLLLLDEPAAGLRNREIDALDAMLVKLCRTDGLTIVLVEHVMQLVMSISDWVTVLNFGTKIAEGTPAAVQANEQVIDAYLGREQADV
ncbi:MAG: ABC transporter ATP-binding protein [Rhodospirillales bacterium]|nr:ABC transporter ATP-binding protein [Rhodospirillales bacterium]